MATTVLIPYQITDGNGDPIAGAQLYAYDTGTTTPKLVYADTDLTILHPVPLVADAEGVFPAVYISSGAIKIDIQDTLGNSINGYPLDPHPVTTGAGGQTAAETSFTSTATVPQTDVQAAIEYLRGLLPATISTQGTDVLEAATPAELLALTGVTATAAELNVLDGFTGTVAAIDTQAFTPSVVDESGNSATTYTARSASYTKIGNRVFIEGQMSGINTTPLVSTDRVGIGSLPFTVKTGVINGVLGTDGVTHAVPLFSNPRAGTTYAWLVEQVASGADTRVLVSDLSSGAADLFFDFSYTTDD